MAQKRQQQLKPRTQEERRAETRARLLDAARALFVEHGFAETGTPQLVHRAGVTRGALYHHFEDKRDLFYALARRESQSVADTIVAKTKDINDPDDGLLVGTQAYFDAMAVPGRAHLLLAEAPAVLGYGIAKELTYLQGGDALRQGLSEAIPDLDPVVLASLFDVLSAAFDRAALAIAEGEDRKGYVQALMLLVGRLVGDSAQ
ncbi:MAG: helix-turn-helix domain-containing protein [Candidatus Thiodiazotropha sp.]